MKRKGAIAIVTASAMLLLAGCGGTSSASPSADTAETVDAEGTTAAGAEAASSAEAEETGACQTAQTGSSKEASLGEAAVNDSLKLASHHVGDLEIRIPDTEMEAMDEGDAEEMDRAILSFTPSDSSLLINDAEVFYYYNALDDETQQIYDAMLMAAYNPESNGNTFSVRITVSENPQGNVFLSEYYRAYYAMLYDHPELFWLYNQIEVELNGNYIDNENGTWDVYIYLTEPYANYEEEMTAFNDAASEFLAGIDTSRSELDIAREVHDKLVGQVTYDMEVADKEEYYNLAHTAYGCLVADSDGNAQYAVCDGYSLAYEYLLQQLGIQTVVIVGEAGSDEESVGGHAWNMANLDGRWYEIDCTWDDDDGAYAEYAVDERIDYQYREALNDAEYMDLVNHAYYAISSAKMRHFTAADPEEYFTASDGTKFSLIGDSVHIRDSELSPEEPLGEVVEVAPLAE